jgi:transposase
VLGHITVQNNEAGLAELSVWCKTHDIKACAVEGANNPFARKLSEGLLQAHYGVVNISPSLTSQYRSKRGRTKSDEVDAENIARAALANPSLVAFTTHAKVEELKTLTRTRALLSQHLTTLRLSCASLKLDKADARAGHCAH